MVSSRYISSTSTWRDLVSSPAGTIVHTFVKGNELVPALKGLALTSILIALISLFANRLIVLVLSSITGLFALATLVTALPKMGAGTLQVGVTARFFWLPEAVGFLGIVITMELAHTLLGKGLDACSISARFEANPRFLGFMACSGRWH
jgi:hypothetical protein